MGNNQYQIVLKVYRDCDSDNVNETGFDGTGTIPQPVIGVYTNSGFDDVYELPFFSDNVESLPVTLDNPCFILPPDLCIETATYLRIVTLPPIQGGYEIVYQRCCRNQSIINIENAEDSGMTLVCQVPGSESSAAGINESARFGNLPPLALCLGGEFEFDHSAIDPDGDQLSYELCPPLLGGGSNTTIGNAGNPDSPQPNPPVGPPFNSIIWSPGFNDNNQLPSEPNFSIDPVTGIITGTPTQLGTYAVGICVKEFKDGQQINSIIRDFQYEVTACDPVIIAAVPEQTQFCDGLSFQFNNTSINATFFEWDFGDPTTLQDTSTLASPLYTYAEGGEYEVTLIANPGWSCADTSSAIYEAYPPLTLVDPIIDFECNNGVPEYTLTGSGDFDPTNSNYSWDFPASFSASGTTDVTETITTSNSGTFGITFTVEENGCDIEYPFNLTIPEPPEAILPSQSLFCEGFTFDFENQSTNAETYNWNFGVIGVFDDVSNFFEPSYTYPDSGTYIVTLEVSAPLTCPDITQTSFDIQELLDPFFENPDPQCFDEHSFDFTASGFSSDNPIFDWQFGNLAIPQESDSQVENNVVWSEPGDYPVTLIISENDCEKSIQQLVEIVANPNPEFDSFLSEGCPPIQITFTNSSTGGVNLNYFWEFGDGNTSTLQSPTNTYMAPGQYDVTLTISSNSGCVEENTLTLADAIQVYPSPTAGFESDLYQVSFLEPTVNITDTSIGSTECFYDFGDGETTFDCDPTHDFIDAGFFDVTQTVWNEYGCFDQLTIPFSVEGHFFYAPNSFTPNNDNLNEQFLPIVIGVTRYQFRIYDRWGDIIFETDDPDQGWDGSVKGGNHYAQDGIYNYQVIVNDLLGFPHEYNGHVAIIR